MHYNKHMSTTEKRIRIRPYVYRGEQGFLVSSGRAPFGISIFTWSRDSAEHIKAKVKAGQQTNLQDYW